MHCKVACAVLDQVTPRCVNSVPECCDPCGGNFRQEATSATKLYIRFRQQHSSQQHHIFAIVDMANNFNE